MKTLVVEDDLIFCESLKRKLSGRRSFTLVHTLEDARKLLKKETFDLYLLDKYLKDHVDGTQLIPEIRRISPSSPILVLTSDDAGPSIQSALDLGATDYVNKSDQIYHELPGRILVAQHRILLEQRLSVVESSSSDDLESSLIGHSTPMRELRRRISELAQSDINVVIHGESGTGKELVAKALHQGQQSKSRPFVSLNCSSFNKDLVETELFGCVRGAYTGAHTDRPGRIEIAHGGVLFLDEIGELHLDVQPKLLRVLESGEYYRVGSNQIKISKPRIISATHRSLEKMVKEGLFREDLYYRIKIVTIETVPLRERLEDIPLLVHHFLLKIPGPPYTVSANALKALSEHTWSGNIRELKNTIEASLVFAKARGSKTVMTQDLLKSTHFRKHLVSHSSKVKPETPAAESPQAQMSYEDYVRKAKHDYLLHLAKENHFNVERIAEKLDIDRSSVYRRFNEAHLDIKRLQAESFK